MPATLLEPRTREWTPRGERGTVAPMVVSTSRADPSRRAREGFAIVLVVLVHTGAFVLSGSSLREAFPLDDAYTHHVYAEGIRFGDGLSYLPGVPAAGSTSPLHALILVPIQLAPLRALVPLTHVLGILGWLALAFATRRLVRVLEAGSSEARAASRRAASRRDPVGRNPVRRDSERSGHEPSGHEPSGHEPSGHEPSGHEPSDRAQTGLDVGSLAALAVALDPALAAAALSGMEVILAALVLVLALVAWAEDRPTLAGVLFGLGILARPELTLAWLSATALMLRRDRRAALWIALPGVIAWSAWAAWNHHAAGTLLPTTFFAKHGPLSILERWRDLPRAIAQTMGAWPMLATLPFVVLGGRALARDTGAKDTTHARTAGLLVLVVLALWPLGLAWAHDLRETWRLYWWRYALPAHPLVLVLMAIGVTRVAEGRRRLALAAIAIALVAGTWSTARHVGESARNILELNVAAARYIDEHAAENDWIASNDAGAVRRLTGRPVVDLLGLNDAEVLVDRAAVLQRRRPRWYVVFQSWFPGLVASPRFEVVHRVHTESLAICGECDQSELLILRTR